MTNSAPAPGLLRALLVTLTVVTGLVDGFSYLSRGHVFVANLTGNVVFLGYGLARVGGIAIDARLVAILAFALGRVPRRRRAAHRPLHRGILMRRVTGAAPLRLAAAASASCSVLAYAATRRPQSLDWR